MKIAAFALLLAFAMTLNAKPKPPIADAIYVHGNLWTGEVKLVNGKAVFARGATAFAVKDGRFLFVGSDADVMQFKGAKTEVVDLKGAFVMPGFNDAHAHLPLGGFSHLNVELVGTKSLEEMLQRIAERAKSAQPGEWIVGRGWDETKWSTVKLPTRQDLDGVTGNRPAAFQRADGHIAVFNTAALKAGGVTRETKAPQGGSIDHDANGEPTGILREDPAEDLVFSKIPRPSPSQRKRALELALLDCNRGGVTSVQDASEVGSHEDNVANWQDFLTWEELEMQEKLTARISQWLPFDDNLKTLDAHRARHPRTDDLLHTGLLKAYMDGSLGSHTAAMLQPYSDQHGDSGLPRYDPAKLNAMAVERAAAGFQLGFHAIGDAGAQMALDAFAAAEQHLREHPAAPPMAASKIIVGNAEIAASPLRYRVEHAQVIAPAQFARFRELGIVASVQPNHLLTDMAWAESRLGAERAKTSYPWRQFLDSGVVLAFGTDYPVEPITPFRGVYAAVTRKNEEGTATYYPEQAVTIDEALRAYTYGSAYAEFMEHEKGLIAPRYLADFVVLDRDLTKVAPKEILGTKVLRTVVGGKTVYLIAER